MATSDGENAPAGPDLRIKVIPCPDDHGGCVRMLFSKPVDQMVMSPEDTVKLAMTMARNAAIVAKKKRIVIPDFGIN